MPASPLIVEAKATANEDTSSSADAPSAPRVVPILVNRPVTTSACAPSDPESEVSYPEQWSTSDPDKLQSSRDLQDPLENLAESTGKV